MRVSIHTVISKYHSTLAVTGESLEEQLIPCLGLGVFESGNTYFVVPERELSKLMGSCLKDTGINMKSLTVAKLDAVLRIKNIEGN